MNNRPARMLNVHDVATELAVSVKSIRRWIGAGDLHCHRIGRQIRISEDDLAAFVGQRRR